METSLDESDDVDTLLRQASEGDQAALTDLFTRHRERLRRMVDLRLNRRLVGRLDPSDVVQETLLQAARDLSGYLREPPLPFFLWLRHIATQKLVDTHRRHLGAEMRDAGREISLHYGIDANSASLAIQLLGNLTGPSQAALRAELQAQLQEALDKLEPLDREVLALRHFEQLSNVESARVLEITEWAASKRYLRALERLAGVLPVVDSRE